MQVQEKEGLIVTGQYFKQENMKFHSQIQYTFLQYFEL